MTELVQCTRCRKVMIDEEYNTHLCRPKIRSYKVMKFTEFYAMKGEDGRTILKIVTLDGDDMMFEEVKENKEYTKIPYVPPPRFQQPRKTPEDSTESKILKKHKLNQNFLHLTKAKAMILMRDS